MKLSKNGLEFLKKHEGVRLKAYTDQAGHLTIGIGHKLTEQELQTGLIVIRGKAYPWKNGLSMAQVEALEDQDDDYAENVINKFVKVPLNQNQFDALVSFIFNVGVSAFLTSTLLKKLNSKDYIGAGNEMPKWNKITDPKTKKKVVSKGLVNRRAADAGLWFSPV